MADEDVKIVIKQKGTIPVYTKTKVGVAEVHHDESLGGKGTVADPLKVSEKIIVDIDSRVEKTDEADKIYGTDAQGNQTIYDKDSFGQVDDVLVNGTSVVVNKIAEVEVPTAVSELTNDEDYQNGTQVSEAVEDGIETHNTSNDAHSNLLDPITRDISDIQDLIPVAASPTNQLADKDYVDDQIGNLNEWTTEQYTPTTTNFVVGQTYTVEEAFQRTASLFEGQQDEIDDIEALIPAQATTQNQLADKSFVNATIATNSANFRGNWATWADVPTDANLYPEDYVGNKKPTNNDYMVVSDTGDYVSSEPLGVVIAYMNRMSLVTSVNGGVEVTHPAIDGEYYIDEPISGEHIFRVVSQTQFAIAMHQLYAAKTIVYGGNTYAVGDLVKSFDRSEYSGDQRSTFNYYATYSDTWRFIYVGDWDTLGKNGWKPTYQIGTPFTQEQQAAIDSGITKNMVDNYVNPTSTANTAYNKRITAVETDKRDVINSANKVYATDANGANKNDLVYSTSATADTIAQRGTNGVLKVGTPVDNADATTKQYVDAVSGDLEDHIDDKNNPHEVTKEQVGLGNVDNTSDLDKPISTATQEALDDKQDTLTAGDNITIENNVISAVASVSPINDVAIHGVNQPITNKTVNLSVVEQRDPLGVFFPYPERHLGRIVQFTGITDASAGWYNGHFYKWVKEGSTFYWKEIEVQDVPTKTSDLTNDSGFVTSEDLATVATSGSYDDLSDKPSLAAVATSGSYNDLSNKPTIPTVGNGRITVYQGNVAKGTFTVNQSGTTTITLDAAGSIGNYLGLWNCTTGTSSLSVGYQYAAGDYFIINAVGEANNKIPSGSSYTGASSTIASVALKVKDMYFYNGSAWELLQNPQDEDDNDAVGVPQIAEVTIKPKNDRVYHSWNTDTNRIILSLNLNKEQIKEKMNDLYIGIERFVRQRSNKEDLQKPKFCMVNDRRPHINKKMYAYRVYSDEGYTQGDPRNYYYFYTPIEYTVQELEEQDPGVFSYMGERLPGGKATCLNELSNIYNFSDVNVGTVYRASELDIDVFANPENLFISNYAEKLICRKYKIAGDWQFLWSANWLRGDTPVYGWPVNAFENDYQNMTVFGTVSEYDNYEYIRRDEMNCWRFTAGDENDFGTFVEDLYSRTMLGHGYGDLHVHWNCYWLDAPIAPILLRNMLVFTRDDTGDQPVELSSITEAGWNLLPEHPKFMLPWSTEYIWLRFCGYQKRCIYNEYSDEIGDNLTITQKDSLKFIYENDNHSANPGFGVRPFGRQNGGYRFSEHAKIQEYIQFNLYEPDCVSIGKLSTSTPVQKKLYLSCFTGANGIRD